MEEQTEIKEKPRRGLNRVLLKYIAAAAMLTDHAAMLFLQPGGAVYVLCRVIGRSTCPIMCMFLAEGFAHTSSRKKYALRLFVFAVLSQPAYTFAHYGTVLTVKAVTDLNVMFTLLIAFAAVACFECAGNAAVKALGTTALVAASYFCDWGIFAPLFVLGMYAFRGSRAGQAAAFCAVAAACVAGAIVFCVTDGQPWYGELWQAGLFLFLPVIYLYNGRRGSGKPVHKWFFYAFYPLHLAALGLIKLCA